MSPPDPDDEPGSPTSTDSHESHESHGSPHSPWPERRRSQALLLGAGAALLVPVALSLAGVISLGGTVVVGSTAIASALLIYGLLGWAGSWVEAGEGGAKAEVAAEEAATATDDG